MTTTATVHTRTATIPAHDVQVGDTLVLPDYVVPVTAITRYNLAYENEKPVLTSSGGWPVLHLLTTALGIVRFPHEQVTVLRDA